MLPQPLVRHPASSCPAIDRIEVELGRVDGGALRLRYRMHGNTRYIVEPACGTLPQRRDALWRHTCCELFVHDEAGGAYREYNFAPNGDWAAYRFSGYRAGCVAHETGPPRIALDRSPALLELTVTLHQESFDAIRTRRIGIACIVETSAGLSYWALAHPPGRPDFHDPCTAFGLHFPLPHAEDPVG